MISIQAFHAAEQEISSLIEAGADGGEPISDVLHYLYSLQAQIAGAIQGLEQQCAPGEVG